MLPPRCASCRSVLPQRLLAAAIARSRLGPCAGSLGPCAGSAGRRLPAGRLLERIEPSSGPQPIEPPNQPEPALDRAPHPARSTGRDRGASTASRRSWTCSSTAHRAHRASGGRPIQGPVHGQRQPQGQAGATAGPHALAGVGRRPRRRDRGGRQRKAGTAGSEALRPDERPSEGARAHADRAPHAAHTRCGAPSRAREGRQPLPLRGRDGATVPGAGPAGVSPPSPLRERGGPQPSERRPVVSGPQPAHGPAGLRIEDSRGRIGSQRGARRPARASSPIGADQSRWSRSEPIRAGQSGHERVRASESG